MKNLSLKIIYTLILVVFAGLSTQSASADTYLYNCPDGGIVTTTASMVPVAVRSFLVNNPTPFTATGQVTSTCATRLVNLKVKNNNDTLVTLIPDTSIAPGITFPISPATSLFTSPAAAGSYALHFTTGVDDTASTGCLNYSGLSTGPDVLPDPANPGNCLKVIRGTILATSTGVWGRNLGNDAELGYFDLKNITITSVGGEATNVWPSPIPLRFRWGTCYKRLYSPYSGPNRFESFGLPAVGGSIVNGFCEFMPQPNPFSMPYGYFQVPGNLPYYVAWDGVHTAPSSPTGFFDALNYDIYGTKNYPTPGGYRFFYTKNHGGDLAWADMVFPLQTLELFDVKVPAGYKLELTSPSGVSTQINIHLFDNSNTVTMPSGTPPHLYPGSGICIFQGSGYCHTITPGQSLDFAPGTYSTNIKCYAPPAYTNMMNTVATPSTFSLPHPGGMTLNAICP